MKKILNKVHKKLLLDIVVDKLSDFENWVVDERKYYSRFIYDDDQCYIFILYSKVYNRIEFYNKARNKFMIYSISFFDRNKLKKSINQLIESKKYEDIDSILDLTTDEDQESENGTIE